MTEVAATAPGRGPGRPPRSAAARAAQRERLLEAVMAAIRDLGSDLSVDEMARAAGVSKPVLYAEFGDKYGIADAVAVALVERGERDLVAEVTRAGGAIDLRSTLRRAIDSFFDIVMGEPAMYDFVARAIRTSDKGLLDNALVRSLQTRFEVVAGVLAPGADPDVLRVLAHGTFGFMIGAIESWRRTQVPGRDEVVATIVQVLGAGLEAARDG